MPPREPAHGLDVAVCEAQGGLVSTGGPHAGEAPVGGADERGHGSQDAWSAGDFEPSYA